MKTIVKILLLGGMALMPFAQGALAADMIQPAYEDVPEVVPVEIGSGWYLRGDVSYDFKDKTHGSYVTYADPDTDVCGDLCGTGYDTQSYDEWKLGESADFGAGVGYQFTDYFRGDLTAHYWHADIDGRNESIACGEFCGSIESSKATAWELMANAYVDMGTFAGFTPYVGAGVGAVNIDYDNFKSTNYFADGSQNSDSLSGENSWRFAYSLMAGVSYDLSKNLKLDAGYRFTDIDGGKMFGGNDLGGIVSGEDDGFQRHTIQAGIRYALF
jgi:opacity protein-like surface antigen